MEAPTFERPKRMHKSTFIQLNWILKRPAQLEASTTPQKLADHCGIPLYRVKKQLTILRKMKLVGYQRRYWGLR